MSWKFWENERVEQLERQVLGLALEVKKLEKATAIASSISSTIKTNAANDKHYTGGGFFLPPDFVSAVFEHYNIPVNEVVLLLLNHLGLSVKKVESKFVLAPAPKKSPPTKRKAKKA